MRSFQVFWQIRMSREQEQGSFSKDPKENARRLAGQLRSELVKSGVDDQLVIVHLREVLDMDFASEQDRLAALQNEANKLLIPLAEQPSSSLQTERREAVDISEKFIRQLISREALRMAQLHFKKTTTSDSELQAYAQKLKTLFRRQLEANQGDYDAFYRFLYEEEVNQQKLTLFNGARLDAAKDTKDYLDKKLDTYAQQILAILGIPTKTRNKLAIYNFLRQNGYLQAEENQNTGKAAEDGLGLYSKINQLFGQKIEDEILPAINAGQLTWEQIQQGDSPLPQRTFDDSDNRNLFFNDINQFFYRRAMTGKQIPEANNLMQMKQNLLQREYNQLYASAERIHGTVKTLLAQEGLPISGVSHEDLKTLLISENKKGIPSFLETVSALTVADKAAKDITNEYTKKTAQANEAVEANKRASQNERRQKLVASTMPMVQALIKTGGITNARITQNSRIIERIVRTIINDHLNRGENDNQIKTFFNNLTPQEIKKWFD